MGAVWAPTVEELVGGVRDGDRISVSGFHFVRSPMAQLRALVAHGPKDLWYVSWGGGLPLEVLLAAGAVSKVTFCFSSLDLFGLAPRFRQRVEAGSLATEEMTALAFIKGLEAAGEGMGFEVLQVPAGSEVFPGQAPPVAGPPGLGGPPLTAAPAIEIDALLLHAQRADDAGNVEIGGARGLDLSLIFAARKVLVTAEERVPRGALGERGSYVLPRTFVTAIALAPQGAWPTSCLPYYATDYRWLHELVKLGPSATAPDLLSAPPRAPALSVLRDVALGKVAHGRVVSAFSAMARPGRADASYSVDELMVCALAREVTNQSICSVGSSSPLATAAYLLAKRTAAPGACIVTHNGCLVDVAFRPMSLLAAEALDHASCAAFAGGDSTYHNYYQRGLVTHEVVPSAQVDRFGATNNVHIARDDGTFVRLPGQGGMADVANLHVNFSLYLTRHSPRTLVNKVDFVSAARTWYGAERARYGLKNGSVALLTNLGRFCGRDQRGKLVLTHVHPGVTVKDVAEATGFPLVVAPDLAETAPPTVEELRVLRQEVDPLGVRRLEFVPARERDVLIEELLDREEAVLEGLTSGGSNR